MRCSEGVALLAAAIDSVDLSGRGITLEFAGRAAGGSSGVGPCTAAFTSSPEGDLELDLLAGRQEVLGYARH